jgi:hypothetical protein
MKTLSKILLWIPLIGVIYYLFNENYNYLVEKDNKWDNYQYISTSIVVGIVLIAILTGVISAFVWLIKLI